LCIKLELIKELYYDARPNKSQDPQRVVVPNDDDDDDEDVS